MTPWYNYPLEPTGKKRWGRKVYRFTQDYRYSFYRNGVLLEILIPKGYETDFASIPWPLHYIIHPDWKWARAALVHDWLCSDKAPRFITDAIFRHIMQEDGVHMRCVLFYSVRLYWVLFGWWFSKLGAK